MIDPIRRKILKAGAAATVIAAAPRVFAQQTKQEALPCPSTKKAPFASAIRRPVPLSVVAHRWRGLNSAISGLTTAPFNPIEEFKGEYRCIASDLRNANTGQSSGPAAKSTGRGIHLPMTSSV